MFFSKNIKLLRKRRKRTQDDIATALGMKRSTLNNYEGEAAEPGLHTLVAFSDFYRVPIDVLLKIDLETVSEQFLLDAERGFDLYVSGGKLRVLATTVDSTNNENIELVPTRAKAGYTAGYADPEFIRELPVFQLPFLSNQRKYRTFQISGDSMLPIPDGAYVTGEYMTNWYDMRTNDACIVVTRDEGVVFKVAENLLTEGGKFRLYSLNPLYEPYDLPAAEIIEIWRFIHYIASEMPSPEVPQTEIIRSIQQLRAEVEKLKNG